MVPSPMVPSPSAVSRLWRNLKELETIVNRILQNPIQYHDNHDLSIYQIRQKIAFIRKLLVLESGSSSLTKPECIEEIANRLSTIETDFVDWATSQASNEQQYEGKEAYSMFVADVEEMVSRVTEEKFREGLEVILTKVNVEEIVEYEEKQTYRQEETIDEFTATFSNANLEEVFGRIGNQEKDQEKIGEEHEHEDKETCYEEMIIEELKGYLQNATLENNDQSVQGQGEDQRKVKQEYELEVKEALCEENIDGYMEGQEENQRKVEKAEVEYGVIVSRGNLENIDQGEEHQHEEKETFHEERVKEELMRMLTVSNLEKVVSELIEKANKKEKRRGSWFRRLGVMAAAAIATVGLTIAIFGPMEELGYLVPT